MVNEPHLTSPQADAGPADTGDAGHPRRILVVDDEADMAELIRQMFRQEIARGTHAFSFAENGAQALDHLDTAPETDVVLSDLNMPQMDGFALLTRIGQSYPLIKTIVITAYGDMDNIRAAMNRGAFDFLNKPIQSEDLRVTLQRALTTVEHLKSLQAARQKAEDDQRRIQDMAMENARASGRAEFATSVLHNISNVLNSLNTSCAHLKELIHNPAVEGLQRANQMLSDHMDDLAGFFSADEKGEKLARFYLKIGDMMDEMNREIFGEIDAIRQKATLMADFIEAQQFHEKPITQSSTLELIGLVKESLTVKEDALKRHGIRVATHFSDNLVVRANRSMLIQVIINLIQNGIEAMSDSPQRVLTIDIDQDDSGRPLCRISDTGEGIADTDGIFTRGYTTKESGHGYGLHFCAKAMEAMGGTIEVDSGGSGTGASFTLRFEMG